MRVTGTYETTTVAGDAVEAFIPHPLPPRDPRLEIDEPRRARVAAAERALQSLDLVAAVVPSLEWFVYAFVRKEAVLSSQIEGTQATLADLLAFEAESATEPHLEPDLEEVCNYLEAIAYARRQIAGAGGLPISIRLLGETHRRLMQGTRGSTKLPSELRRSQNWIGGTRPGNAHFVPPPPHRLAGCLTALERYIHGYDDIPPLIRAGLCHVQLETIHPYLDGNGRLGRLLVSLLLEHWGLLGAPLLYLSIFFRRHQGEYYRRLDAVRRQGDWEGWTDFFLDGVATVAGEATHTARQLSARIVEDRARVLATSASSIMAARLFELVPLHPILTVAGARALLETTKPTASKAIDTLVAAGVLEEVTGRQRDRIYRYTAYLGVLED